MLAGQALSNPTDPGARLPNRCGRTEPGDDSERGKVSASAKILEEGTILSREAAIERKNHALRGRDSLEQPLGLLQR